MLSVSPKDTVKHAIEIMKKFDVSALPVVDTSIIQGVVTERNLLTGLYDKMIGSSNHIATVMEQGISTILENESVERASQLLSKDSIIIILNSHQKPLGVVSRIDLIEFYT